ncbi:hypothetical protein ACLB1S_02375 [Escherichia coli]
MVTFQIGGYEPCTVTDFEVCKRHGLEQTIADTLDQAVVPRATYHSASVANSRGIAECARCRRAFSDSVNPMAMNTWAMYAPSSIRISNRSGCAIGCREQQELAHQCQYRPATLRYRCAGINHITLPGAGAQNRRRQLRESLPELLAAYEAGQAPKPNIHGNTGCQNIFCAL